MKINNNVTLTYLTFNDEKQVANPKNIAKILINILLILVKI